MKFLQPPKQGPPFFFSGQGREQKTDRKDKNRHLAHTQHRVGGKINSRLSLVSVKPQDLFVEYKTGNNKPHTVSNTEKHQK